MPLRQPDIIDRVIGEEQTMDVKQRIIEMLWEHQEGATENLDLGRDECRCGSQGDQHWRGHFADILIASDLTRDIRTYLT